MNIDFSMLRQSPFAGALDPITAAISEVTARRHQREQQEERLKFAREQEERLRARDQGIIERDNRKADLADRREVGERTAKNVGNRQNISTGIRGDVARGDFDSAEQRAASYAEQDPRTGDLVSGPEALGFKVTRPPPAPAPLASPVEYGPREAEPEPSPTSPQSLPDLGEEGPMATPAISNRAGETRAYQRLADEPSGYTLPTDENPHPDERHVVDTVNDEVHAAAAERRRFGGQRDTALASVDPAQQAVSPTDPRLAERTRFNAQNTPEKDAEMASYQQQGEASARPPEVQLGGVKLDQEKLRYAGARQDAADFQKLMPVLQTSYAQALETKDPQAIKSAQRRLEVMTTLEPMVESGQMSGKDAANKLFGVQTADYKLGGDLEKLDKQGGYAQTRAETAAAATAARGEATDKRGAATAARQDSNASRLEAKDRSKVTKEDLDAFFQRFNAKTTQEAAQEFPNIVKMLDSGNGKLQDQALITMMRLAQKDNRFSDADAKLAMRSGAGWLDQMESYVSKGVEGNYGQDVIAAARQAAGALQGYYNAKNDAMNQEADSFLGDDALYDTKRAASRLGRELPGFRQRHPDLYGGKGGGQPAATGQRSAPGSPEDVNSEAPLPQDPNADELPGPTGGRTGGGKRRMTRQEAEAEARRRGLIP